MTVGQALSGSVILKDGVRVFYTVAGFAKNTIMLIHGGSGSRHEWDSTAAILAKHYTVIALDLIGFGDSDRPKGKYTYKILAESVISVLDDLGIKKTNLIGHSLGGRVALEVARSRPQRVSSLVMIAPMGFGKLSLIGLMLGFFHWAAHRVTFTRLPYPDLDILIDDRTILNESSISSRTKIIWGENDPLFPVNYVARVKEIISAASVEVFTNCGHSPHFESNERFITTVLEFLDDSDLKSSSTNV